VVIESTASADTGSRDNLFRPGLVVALRYEQLARRDEQGFACLFGYRGTTRFDVKAAGTTARHGKSLLHWASQMPAPPRWPLRLISFRSHVKTDKVPLGNSLPSAAPEDEQWITALLRGRR
jgi:hypothetical protein